VILLSTNSIQQCQKIYRSNNVKKYIRVVYGKHNFTTDIIEVVFIIHNFTTNKCKIIFFIHDFTFKQKINIIKVDKPFMNKNYFKTNSCLRIRFLHIDWSQRFINTISSLTNCVFKHNFFFFQKSAHSNNLEWNWTRMVKKLEILNPR